MGPGKKGLTAKAPDTLEVTLVTEFVGYTMEELYSRLASINLLGLVWLASLSLLAIISFILTFMLSELHLLLMTFIFVAVFAIAVYLVERLWESLMSEERDNGLRLILQTLLTRLAMSKLDSVKANVVDLEEMHKEMHTFINRAVATFVTSWASLVVANQDLSDKIQERVQKKADLLVKKLFNDRNNNTAIKRVVDELIDNLLLLLRNHLLKMRGMEEGRSIVNVLSHPVSLGEMSESSYAAMRIRLILIKLDVFGDLVDNAVAMETVAQIGGLYVITNSIQALSEPRLWQECIESLSKKDEKEGKNKEKKDKENVKEKEKSDLFYLEKEETVSSSSSNSSLLMSTQMLESTNNDLYDRGASNEDIKIDEDGFTDTDNNDYNSNQSENDDNFCITNKSDENSGSNNKRRQRISNAIEMLAVTASPLLPGMLALRSLHRVLNRRQRRPLRQTHSLHTDLELNTESDTENDFGKMDDLDMAEKADLERTMRRMKGFASLDESNLLMSDSKSSSTTTLSSLSSAMTTTKELSSPPTPTYEEPQNLESSIDKLRALLEQHSTNNEEESDESSLILDPSLSAKFFDDITIPLVEEEGNQGNLLYCIHYDGIYLDPDRKALVAQPREVKRRFKEFLHLQSRLEDDSEMKVHLKGIKPISKWVRVFKPGNVQIRRTMLETWLKALCTHPTLSLSSDLRSFLAYGDEGSRRFGRKSSLDSDQDHAIVKTMSCMLSSLRDALPTFDVDETRSLSAADIWKGADARYEHVDFVEEDTSIMEDCIKGFLNEHNDRHDLNLSFKEAANDEASFSEKQIELLLGPESAPSRQVLLVELAALLMVPQSSSWLLRSSFLRPIMNVVGDVVQACSDAFVSRFVLNADNGLAVLRFIAGIVFEDNKDNDEEKEEEENNNESNGGKSNPFLQHLTLLPERLEYWKRLSSDPRLNKELWLNVVDLIVLALVDLDRA